MGYGVVITVAAQYQHSQIVGANGIAINIIVELVCQNNVGGDFSHQPNLKVLATAQAAVSHNSNNLFAFLYVAAEGNHYVQVLQAELFAYLAYSQAFQLEGFDIFRIIVTGSTAPAQQSGRFIGLELVATLQITVFARFEVGEAQGNRSRSHSLANLANAFSQLVHNLFRLTNLNQIQRMLMDIGSPDELLAHQANAIAGQSAVFFCQLGVAQIHINLGAGGREIFCSSNNLLSRLFSLGFFNDAFINNAMSCINGYINAIRNSGGSSFTAALSTNDAGNTQLAGYDGSVAGHAAAIGYNSLRLLHSRYPVGSGHFGYQNFAFLELVNAGRIQNYMYAASHITRASRQTFDNYFAVSSHFLLLFRCATIFFIATAPYGFRASLQDVNLVVALVNAPFHIHVAAIVSFNFLSAFSQFFDLSIGQLLLVLFIQRNHYFFAVASSLTNQLDILTIDILLNDFSGSLINGVVIRGYSALYNVFAQAPSAFDKNVLIVAGSNVNSEHNACSLGEYHHLYCCRKSNIQMVKALFFTIVYSAVGKAGSIAFLNLCYDGSSALNIQIGILLTSERSVRQVLSGSAGANCYEGISLADLFAQLFISFSNQVLQVLGHFLIHDSLANLGANLTQLSAVVHIQTGNQVFNLFIETGFFEEISVGASSGCKAIGYGHIHMGG